ncbi:predicted protein [Streptomyces sp. C]|nr:predicted protein [Streptomyces sp. C]
MVVLSILPVAPTAGLSHHPRPTSRPGHCGRWRRPQVCRTIRGPRHGRGTAASGARVTGGALRRPGPGARPGRLSIRAGLAGASAGGHNPHHAQAAELPLYLWHRPVRSPWVRVMLA